MSARSTTTGAGEYQRDAVADLKKLRDVRVLLTEGASLSARQTLYAIGPLVTVDVIDPDPLCQCRFSRYVRQWMRCPSFAREPEVFLRFLIDLLRNQQYDVLLPTHEQVYLLSRYRDQLVRHAGLALPDFTALERMQNKADFARLLIELDLPQPEVTIVKNVDELQQSWRYPVYLKLAHSTAGSGVFHIENDPQLQQQIEQLLQSDRLEGVSEMLMQQPARGVQSTVQAVFDHGRLVGVHCFEARALGVGGMSTARTSADHPLVVQHMERLGAHLEWHGATFVDYYYDTDTGRPEYIEANPRIGETVNALLSGINLPLQLIHVSRGERPAPLPCGRTDVRSHSGYMTLMSTAFFGGGRWQLFKQLIQMLSGRGLFRDAQDELTRLRVDPWSLIPFVFITLQLLAWPKLARRIVSKTVRNYSLPESATAAIKALPSDLLDGAETQAGKNGDILGKIAGPDAN